MLHLLAKFLMAAFPLIFLQQAIRVDVSLVTVGVRVTDSRGRDVRGLKADDFIVTEDGVPQRIASFSDELQPITLGIILDRSSSMEAGRKLERAKDAAQTLIKVAKEGSEYFFVEFSEKVRLAVDFTSRREELLSAIARTEAEGSTSLYDAILEGLTASGRASLARQVLVVISDGADQHSTHELQEVMEIVRSSGTQIYTIGYFSKDEEQMFRTSAPKFNLTNGAEVDNPLLALQKIAEESGAMSFFPRSDEELRRAVARINEDLMSQYSLGFYPAQLDNSNYRQLTVAITGNRYAVRSRPGYGVREFAPGTSLPKAAVSRAYESKVTRRDGRLIYREDFSDAGSGWPERENAGYVRGGYRLRGEDVVVSAGPEFLNFQASVVVSVEDVPPPSNPLPRVGERNLPTTGIRANPVGGGLVFRHTGSSYYALILYPPNELRAGLAVVMYMSGARSAELVRWSLLSRPSRRREIRVQCAGQDCEFFEGGALLGRLNSIAAEAGQIGLVQTANGAATFDTLLVEATLGR